jgi:hypothetical protein
MVDGLCHCNRCRPQSGTAFSTVIFIHRSALTITGETAVFSLLDRGGRRAAPELRNLARKGVRTMSVAQHDLMTNPQGFPRKPKRDRTSADRSELHDAACRSLERSRRTMPIRPGRPTCATASVIRDGG